MSWARVAWVDANRWGSCWHGRIRVEYGAALCRFCTCLVWVLILDDLCFAGGFHPTTQYQTPRSDSFNNTHVGGRASAWCRWHGSAWVAQPVDPCARARVQILGLPLKSRFGIRCLSGLASRQFIPFCLTALCETGAGIKKLWTRWAIIYLCVEAASLRHDLNWLTRAFEGCLLM